MGLFLDTSRVILSRVKDLRALTSKRHRVKGKWAATQPKQPPTKMALQHFDATYSTQLGALWPSIRVALLSERKYGALLNHFSHNPDVEELQGQGCKDFISNGEAFMFPASADHHSEFRPEEDSSSLSTVTHGGGSWQPSPLRLSPNIRCLVFPRGDITRFRPARPDKFGLLSYYLLDAASMLPCLALDVQESHTVLDLCAAPGGKALALLQTQSVRFLCANDLSVSRTSRLKRVLHSYVPKALLTDDKLCITSFDGTIWGEIERNSFDRVLVDVPCTTDRHSLMDDDNNIFSRSRVGERRSLPQLQAQLLLAGILAACPGGDVLYSTCTLSANQNQAVVQQAVQLAEEQHGIQLQVISLRPLAQMFSNTFHFAPDLHLGEMVIPHLAANFGPIYLCKLRRLT
ncbi:5-cytosine rRNA methyltransferase NSUN4 isoform X2 [Poecilia reticulata]|uniref:5-cytosine rRNA methyltransferase NSUN4 n=1 Tax=Poecilia reticulata TaxID=8081 RepID=A0A3P9NS20_POERE|nr:PREDICTED: 5-methylcytosine rRNA methyltransferase NSUN4 isoform X2 [Poecilia reticulata]